MNWSHVERSLGIALIPEEGRFGDSLGPWICEGLPTDLAAPETGSTFEVLFLSWGGSRRGRGVRASK